jgi:hypothetical protein
MNKYQSIYCGYSILLYIYITISFTQLFISSIAMPLMQLGRMECIQMSNTLMFRRKRCCGEYWDLRQSNRRIGENV